MSLRFSRANSTLRENYEKLTKKKLSLVGLGLGFNKYYPDASAGEPEEWSGWSGWSIHLHTSVSVDEPRARGWRKFRDNFLRAQQHPLPFPAEEMENHLEMYENMWLWMWLLWLLWFLWLL